MAEFHFIEDYEKHIKSLKKSYPIDEAMSLAVGGDYERIGQILVDILSYAGLRDGMSVIDFGCGSGRAAKAISSRYQIELTGFDVVQDLLDYAALVCPKNYRFFLNRSLKIPAETNSTDMVFAFSVFTHLLHEETYLYLEEISRILKTDGTLVFSFLEFKMPTHWAVFDNTVKLQKESNKPHLNMFIERNQIQAFADHMNFDIQEFVDGTRALSDKGALGQSIAILRSKR